MAEIEVKRINCGSCGAPLELRSAFTKSIVCQFCETTNLVDDKGINPTGKMAKISQARSIFAIGRTGTLKERKFEVLGRLRYGYDEGFWDEWFLQFDDGQCGWVTEEEGEISLFNKDLLTSPIENIDKLRVGQYVQVEDKKVFLTEISECSILGGEGELHYRVTPGKPLLHLEGNADGKLVSIEVWPKEIEIHNGIPILYRDVVMDKVEDPYA
jgi:LSD1 subclass zinc finger protein